MTSIHTNTTQWWGLALLAGLLLLPLAVRAEAPIGSHGGQSWGRFFEQLDRRIDAAASGQSAAAARDAADARLAAARGEVGLSLNANAQYYPDGLGATDETGFTNLEQRAEVRLQWQVLDFIARRGGRIDQAHGEQQLATARARQLRLEAAALLLDDAICSQITPMRQRALEAALHATQEALERSRAAEAAPRAPLARAAETGTDRAMRLQAETRGALATLTHCPTEGVPLPSDFMALRKLPPSAEEGRVLAADHPEIAQLRASAAMRRGEARALTLEGFQFGVYGGYIAQRRDQENRTVDSAEPQVGASLTVPIRFGGNGQRRAMAAQANALALDAQVMLDRQERTLNELRHTWAASATRMEVADRQVEQASERLQILERRATGGVSGAEPWNVALQRAELWRAVGEAWLARGAWLEAVLGWALHAPDTLDRMIDPQAAPTAELCSPLPECPS